MPTRRNEPQTSPERFFVKELKGEEGPRLELMRNLCMDTVALFRQQPWEELNEEEVVLLPRQGGGMVICSMLGAMGVVRALNVYLSSDAYYWTLEAAEAAQAGQMEVGEYMARQNMLQAQLVKPGEMTAADRAMLRGVGLPAAGQKMYLQFRSFRPGYLPWYVTETEAQVLRWGAVAMTSMLAFLQSNQELNPWADEDTYPMLTPRKEGGFVASAVKLVRQDEGIAPPELDENRIDIGRARRLPQGRPVWVVDSSYLPATVGGKLDRPYPVRVTLVLDARSGLVHHTEVHGPEESVGDGLWRVLLEGMAQEETRPAVVRTRRKETARLLRPLAEHLGITVEVKNRIAALEEAKASLFEHLSRGGFE